MRPNNPTRTGAVLAVRAAMQFAVYTARCRLSGLLGLLGLLSVNRLNTVIRVTRVIRIIMVTKVY